MFLKSACPKQPSLFLRARKYATRSEFEAPRGFDINFKPYRRPFFSWKPIVLFGAAGAYLAYSEVFFEQYAKYTEIDHSELLPIQLEFKLKTLPIYQKLTKTKEANDWVMMKSYENLDRNVLERGNNAGVLVDTTKSGGSNQAVKPEAEYAAQSLTSHALAQPGGIAIAPVIFHNNKTDETVTIVHMGYRLCGFPFVVHGGMIATLLNETFKRNASLRSDIATSAKSGHLKDDYKVEELQISYRRPSFANQFFVVKTEKVENEVKKSEDSTKTDPEGGNATYKSVLQAEDGSVLVEARAVLRNTGRASRQQASLKKWGLF